MEPINLNNAEIQPYDVGCTVLCGMASLVCTAIACGLAVFGFVITSTLAPMLSVTGGTAADVAVDVDP